jgi:hypothetical protein
MRNTKLGKMIHFLGGDLAGMKKMNKKGGETLK